MNGGDPNSLDGWLVVDSEAGRQAAMVDWAATPLGDLGSWPQSLRTAANICLSSSFPMLVMWGPELIMLYNGAYLPLLGERKRLRVMGQRVRDCWQEVWPDIGHLLEGVLDSGRAVWRKDQHLVMARNGYEEECYFTFSYSPIHDETGGVGGVLATLTETTERVLGERRLRTLHELAQGAINSTSTKEACTWLGTALAANPTDLPFALVYSVTEGGASLVSAAGTPASAPAVEACWAASGHARAVHDRWPIAEALASGGPVTADIVARFGAPATTVDGTHVSQALVLPVVQTEPPSGSAPAGSMVLVAGVNPRRPLDGEYRRFLQLVAHHVGAALVAARVRTEERRRGEAEWLRSLNACSPIGIFTSDDAGRVTYTNPMFGEIVGLTSTEALGERWMVAVHPEERERVAAEWHAAVGAGHPVDIVVRLQNRQLGLRWTRVRTAPLRLGGGVVIGHVGTVEDITEQREMEVALRRAEFQSRELVELSQAVVWRGVGELPRITFVNRRAAELSGIPVERWMSEPLLWVEHTLPEDREAVLAAVREARYGPQEVQHRMRDAEGRVICLRDFVRYVGETAAGPEYIGVMFDETALRRSREEVEESRVRLRDLAERLQTIREQEQARIAREIHDELGQLLTGLKLQLSWLAGRLPAGDARLAGSAGEMLSLTDSIINTVRRIATRLRPGVLDDLGLFAALEWLARDFEHRTGVPCSLTLPANQCELAEQHATTLFRIAQEALTNVARHARASAARISLRREGDKCVLEVADDGRGMSTQVLGAQHSLGLLGMRERAISSGGEMEIRSAQGRGTIVRARVGGRQVCIPEAVA